MKSWEDLIQFPVGDMTKPEIVEKSVHLFLKHCQDYQPVCWCSFLGMIEGALSLVLGWVCVWLELFDENVSGELYIDDWLLLACIEDVFNYGASMTSGPFNARDYTFLYTDWRWWKPRVFIVQDSNY